MPTVRRTYPTEGARQHKYLEGPSIHQLFNGSLCHLRSLLLPYPLLHNTFNSLPFHTSQRPSHFNHDMLPTVHIRRLSSPVSIVPPFYPVFFPLFIFLWPHAFRFPRFVQRHILFHVLPRPRLEIPKYRSLLRIKTLPLTPIHTVPISSGCHSLCAISFIVAGIPCCHFCPPSELSSHGCGILHSLSRNLFPSVSLGIFRSPLHDSHLRD